MERREAEVIWDEVWEAGGGKWSALEAIVRCLDFIPRILGVPLEDFMQKVNNNLPLFQLYIAHSWSFLEIHIRYINSFLIPSLKA